MEAHVNKNRDATFLSLVWISQENTGFFICSTNFEP